jgi:hypothetical protein
MGAIEVIQEGLRVLGYPDRISVDEVLVPEQCATVTMAGDIYHVQVTKLAKELTDLGNGWKGKPGSTDGNKDVLALLDEKQRGMPMFTRQGCVQRAGDRASRPDPVNLPSYRDIAKMGSLVGVGGKALTEILDELEWLRRQYVFMSGREYPTS